MLHFGTDIAFLLPGKRKEGEEDGSSTTAEIEALTKNKGNIGTSRWAENGPAAHRLATEQKNQFIHRGKLEEIDQSVPRFQFNSYPLGESRREEVVEQTS